MTAKQIAMLKRAWARTQTVLSFCAMLAGYKPEIAYEDDQSVRGRMRSWGRDHYGS